METNICLKTLGKAFENGIHINAIRISPCMLKVLLKSLSQRIWYLKPQMEMRISDSSQNLTFLLLSL